MKIGFDNDKYIKLQSEKIMERINSSGNKLYLEFGGKLFDDYHASRVLPGFLPDVKIRMLSSLADKAEIIIVINSDAIENNKMREDIGITYETDVLRLIDAFHSFGLYVGSVVVTRYKNNKAVNDFIQRLNNLNFKVYKHYEIEGYPSNIDNIVSDNGYGKNEYIETTRPLVVVTAPGPGSGKMATCLSQLYHENKRGIKAGYSKYETFPIWNLALSHPVNIAYEAATVDLNDRNIIDPFHLEAYGETTVNYNRDVEIYPVLSAMLTKIMGESQYKSPTDMGVNMAGYCIFDDEVVRMAARDEIIRRYYNALCDKAMGKDCTEEVKKLEYILQKANIDISERLVVLEALKKEESTNSPAIAIKLDDDSIVTGRATDILCASATVVINALKKLAEIRDEIHVISPIVFEPIQKLRTNLYGQTNRRLTLSDALIAISISAATNPLAGLVLEQIPKLKGAQAHSSVILNTEVRQTIKQLGIQLSMQPKYETNRLYHN